MSNDWTFTRHLRLNTNLYERCVDFLNETVVNDPNVKLGGMPRTPAEKKALMFLWYMANTNSFREISSLMFRRSRLIVLLQVSWESFHAYPHDISAGPMLTRKQGVVEVFVIHPGVFLTSSRQLTGVVEVFVIHPGVFLTSSGQLTGVTSK